MAAGDIIVVGPLYAEAGTGTEIVSALTGSATTADIVTSHTHKGNLWFTVVKGG